MIVHEAVLSRFARFVEAEMGLHFPPERLADLQRGIASAAREFNFDAVEDCIRWLMSAPMERSQIEVLASHLTVGETYFFREKKVFEALENQILPELVRSGQAGERRLRIWSAACCSGEEPYSIAISVRRALPQLADWQITILGTDINYRFLEKAKRGIYSDWSFRDTPPGFRHAYFKSVEDGRWEIRSDIRKMVTFFHLNLAEDAYPSLLNNTNGLDLIFCRNVLIYFGPDQARRVIQNLTRCLREGGRLALGPNESSHVSFPDLTSERIPSVTIYRKNTAKSRIARAEFSDSSKELVPLDGASCAYSVGEFSAEPNSSCANNSPSIPPVQSTYLQALSLYDQGRYCEVEEILRNRAGGESHNPQVVSLLARALANQGKLCEALVESDLLVVADKLNPSGHYLRATILQEQGNLKEAEVAFKRALYVDSEFVLAHFGLGNLARLRENFGASDKHFKNALLLAQARPPSEVLPESDGITAGRLAEIITAVNPSTLREVHSALS